MRLLVLLAALVPLSCGQQESTAKEIATLERYSAVDFIHVDRYWCDDEWKYESRFRATAPDGSEVLGVICFDSKRKYIVSIFD